MSAKELYIELQKPIYDVSPYSRIKDRGEGMEIVKEVINNYWRVKFLINHEAKEAFLLMDHNLRLLFLSPEDVDWQSVEKLENNRNAYSLSAHYPPFAVEKFKNGVAFVQWTLYPDGNYFMDEDGFGMEDNDESALFGFIDKKARVVIPFQAMSWVELEKQRTEAEQRANIINKLTAILHNLF